MNDYSHKRANFIGWSVVHFEFLVSDLGFQWPTHGARLYTNADEKTFVMSDWLSFERDDVLVILMNDYHPYDYGFQLLIADPSDRVPDSGIKPSSAEMIYYKTKENQDREQSYLTEAAKVLRQHLPSRG